MRSMAATREAQVPDLVDLWHVRPDELGAMLDEFDAICDLTAPKQEKQAEDEDEQTAFDEELVSQAQAAGLSQAS